MELAIGVAVLFVAQLILIWVAMKIGYQLGKYEVLVPKEEQVFHASLKNKKPLPEPHLPRKKVKDDSGTPRIES